MEVVLKERAASQTRRVQLGCLLSVLLMTFAFFVLESRASGVAFLMVERYITIPSAAFLGASLCRELPRRNRWYVYAGLVMAVFFFLNQITHQVLESQSKEIGTFVCAYALCFPFAAAAEDSQRQTGLKSMAGLFLATGALLTVYTALLLLDKVPGYLQNYVNWDGARLNAMGHPNICATLLMISMGLCAGFALSCRKRWVKVGLLALMVLQFLALSLTNGRTTVILTCLLMGGILFCVLRGRGWKRLIPALLAAAVVVAGLFITSRMVYSWNQSRLVQQAKTSTVFSSAETLSEAPAAVENKQHTLVSDLKTLNSRTVIWQAARMGLEDNSQIKWIGTEYVEMILTRYLSGTIYHTHNSWLEALYRMGLPGLGAALVITVLTVWSTVVVLWRNTDLWKSCIALLTLCLLGCALLEPYLFVADVSYFYLDFLFMMCLGYLCLWRGEKEA